MKGKLRVIASLLAITLWSSVSIVSATNVNELRSEVQVNQAELDKVMIELGKMEDEIQKVNNKIEVAINEVETTDKKIGKVEGDISTTNNELAEAKEEKTSKEKQYGDRIVEIYKRGKLDYLMYVLSTKSIEDLVTRFELAQKAMDYDEDVIDDLKGKQENITKAVNKLESQKNDLNTLKDEQQKNVDELNDLKVEYEGKRNELNVRQDQYKNEIAELERQIEELVKPIIVTNTNTNTNTNSNTNQQVTDQVTESVQNANTNQQQVEQQVEQVEVAQTSNVNRGSYGTGSDIANYAAQFLGVPYVWGGTSPSGFDCSGLTQYCYLNAAGISIPRVAADQQNAGYAVSTPQSGDLVFFGYPAYHVGIYVGNDTYIHAPTSGDVVKYSKLSYASSYSGARRYR